MIFCKISKFHDISMTGKAFIIFPGFPGAVGTLITACTGVKALFPKFLSSHHCLNWFHGIVASISVTASLLALASCHHCNSKHHDITAVVNVIASVGIVASLQMLESQHFIAGVRITVMLLASVSQHHCNISIMASLPASATLHLCWHWCLCWPVLLPASASWYHR